MLERKAYEAEVAELSETAAFRDEFRVQRMRWTKSVAKNRIDMPWSVVSCKLTLLETQVASAPSQAQRRI
jgi:hypothetical protein